MNELAKSEEFFVKTQEVIQGIQKYLLDLEYATDYILTFEQVVKAVHPYEEPVINVIPLWRTSF